MKRALETRPPYATDEQWRHVARLYASYHASPLWIDDRGVVEDRAHTMVNALASATGDGIRIDDFPLLELVAYLDTLGSTRRPTPQQIIRTDLLLTTSYAALGEDYLTGQIDPKTVSQSWHIDPREEEVDSALVRSLRDPDLAKAIERMRPQEEDYRLLRGALDTYRKIVAAGGWVPIATNGSLARGDRDPVKVPALRARLRQEGYETGSGDVYDDALAAAVAQFQARHVIAVDSAVGPETRDALSVPASFRLSQVAANLERYRWLPRTLGDKYILVNVPSFRLEGHEGGNTTIEMKVIVGAEYEGRSTPVFSDSMELVVFRPYWDVPPSIARKEILPNGVPEGYEMSYRGGEPHLRQRPGPKNALGLVKFLFPNDFNVYLHDTPQDELFKKDVRAFSHGCIRLEKPAELAQWVLGWDAERVNAAMEHGPNARHVTLPRKVPVYITYMTAYVRDSAVWFANDLYHRDDQLVQAVAGGAMPSGAAVRAVAALRKLTQ
ncbi:MAG TPA: L,D-transpeptidase family protein [Gemmatimonadaceae bacterium]|nr:L,D-transpeptidase family protein [Gemmatimonadaceae bacterium]